MPLPETYTNNYAFEGQAWGNIYKNTTGGSAGSMQFYGVMNDSSWNDSGNYYGLFFGSGYGEPWPQIYLFDTCMPSLTWKSQSAAPCY